MEDAFRQLEKLESIDNMDLDLGGGDSDGDASQEQRQKKTRDTAFAKAMKELNLKDIASSSPPASAESEAELYKDMAEELSMAESEEDLKADLTLDLEDVVVTSSIDTNNEEFVNKAIEEALKDAKDQNENVGDKEAFLDNKEIMSEIEKIFDRANDQLMEGLEEIRTEQVRRKTSKNSRVCDLDR